MRSHDFALPIGRYVANANAALRRLLPDTFRVGFVEDAGWLDRDVVNQYTLITTNRDGDGPIDDIGAIEVNYSATQSAAAEAVRGLIYTTDRLVAVYDLGGRQPRAIHKSLKTQLWFTS